VSLTPDKLSADDSWVIDLVDSATIEVRVSIEAKLESAGSDAYDSQCKWGGPSLLIPENVTATARALEALVITVVTSCRRTYLIFHLDSNKQHFFSTRALDALSRNSSKDLASTSTHCDCYERAVIIRNCIVDEYIWHLTTSRMDVTSMMSNDVADKSRWVTGSGMEVLAMHTNSCGRRCLCKQSPFVVLGTDQVALEPAKVRADDRKGSGSGSSASDMIKVLSGTDPELDVADAVTVKVSSVGEVAVTTKLLRVIIYPTPHHLARA